MKSRKFLLSVFVVASATALVYVGSIGDAVYATTVGTVVAAYIAGNVSQKAVQK